MAKSKTRLSNHSGVNSFRFSGYTETDRIATLNKQQDSNMENLDLNLTLSHKLTSQELPKSCEYILFLDTLGKLRYGFWNEQFDRFYYAAGWCDKSQVVCWYSIPKVDLKP